MPAERKAEKKMNNDIPLHCTLLFLGKTAYHELLMTFHPRHLGIGLHFFQTLSEEDGLSNSGEKKWLH